MKGWTFALMRTMKPPRNVTLQNHPSSGATAFNEVSLAIVSSTEGNFGMAIYPTSFRIPTVVEVVANYDHYSLSADWRPYFEAGMLHA